MAVKDRERLAKELFSVSLDTLESMPGRALGFLRAAGTNLAIFSQLQTRGYSKLIHRDGWRLLQAASNVGVVADDTPDIAPEVADAIAKLDDLDDEWYQIITASLKYEYPDQLAIVIGDKKPARGAGAVLNMSSFSQGLNVLESSPERAATREADAKALELIAPRGIGAKERAAVAALLEKAMSTPEAKPRSPEEIAAADEAYVRALGALRQWYDVWSTIARVAVRRRDRLIQLGLAHRKSPAEPEEPEAGGGVTPAPAGGGTPTPGGGV